MIGGEISGSVLAAPLALVVMSSMMTNCWRMPSVALSGPPEYDDEPVAL